MTQPAPVGMNTAPSVFCASFELSASKWKLGFSDGARRKLATVDAKDWKAVEVEIARARQRFGIEEKAPLFTCYEAGRDGFWIHRELEKRSIRNIVVDPSSIEVSRRARRAKTDSIDAIGLVEKLVKYVRGDLTVWQVAKVPSVEEEDARRLHRERGRLELKAIGPTSATVLVSELFGWRDFKNGKQVGACAGLVPTPYSSGEVEREQGISRAGNKRVRTLCVEIAWCWVRYQPDSALTKWFNARFAKGGGRSRRLGIVALARKLLVALWRYLEHGVVPEGAIVKA